MAGDGNSRDTRTRRKFYELDVLHLHILSPMASFMKFGKKEYFLVLVSQSVQWYGVADVI